MENGQTSASSHDDDLVNDDVVIASSPRVMCEGSGGAMGHPRTYLDMGSDTSVVCKYCGRIFKLDPHAAADGHH